MVIGKYKRLWKTLKNLSHPKVWNSNVNTVDLAVHFSVLINNHHVCCFSLAPQCEECLYWQHGTCMGLLEENVPERYACFICRDSPGLEVMHVLVVISECNPNVDLRLSSTLSDSAFSIPISMLGNLHNFQFNFILLVYLCVSRADQRSETEPAVLVWQGLA